MQKFFQIHKEIEFSVKFMCSKPAINTNKQLTNIKGIVEKNERLLESDRLVLCDNLMYSEVTFRIDWTTGANIIAFSTYTYLILCFFLFLITRKEIMSQYIYILFIYVTTNE